MDGHAVSRKVPHPPLPGWVPRRPISADEYQRMGEAGILGPADKVELIEGELVAVSPMGSPHAGRLMILSQHMFALAQGRAVVSVQVPVRLGAFSEPEPDVALLRLPAHRYVEKLPGPDDILLLIEVSESSLRYDRTEKAALYARHGVAEYWIIDLTAKAVILHREPKEEGYALVRQALPDETLEPVLLLGLRVSAADILA